MSRIVGIDVSLTSTGVAVIEDGRPAWACVSTSTGRRGDDIPTRRKRITRVAVDVTRGPRPTLIVIEGPSYASRGGSAWDRAGLWWAILDRWDGVPVAVVPPANRARWATGRGNADKAAVAAVAARLCPDVALTSSDAADALILALMGSHALGERPDLDTTYRRDALCRCEWPPDITSRVLAPYGELQTEETPDD